MECAPSPSSKARRPRRPHTLRGSRARRLGGSAIVLIALADMSRRREHGGERQLGGVVHERSVGRGVRQDAPSRWSAQRRTKARFRECRRKRPCETFRLAPKELSLYVESGLRTGGFCFTRPGDRSPTPSSHRDSQHNLGGIASQGTRDPASRRTDRDEPEVAQRFHVPVDGLEITPRQARQFGH